MEEKVLSPDELIAELERRAFQERGLVVITVGQWEAITQAYHSPMVERIAESAMSVYPAREVKTKALKFTTYTRGFHPR